MKIKNKDLFGMSCEDFIRIPSQLLGTSLITRDHPRLLRGAPGLSLKFILIRIELTEIWEIY